MRAELLKDICHFQKGETGLAKAEPGKYSLVTTGAERKTCNTYQFDTKAVCIPLVSSTGHGHASLKNVHYQEGRFALGTILVALTAINVDELNIQFLHLYLSQLKDQVLVPLMSGAANVALSITKIKGIEIPLPTIERQTEIVEQFRSIVQEEGQLKTELTHQQTLLKKLRQQILQEAIEGKLTADWRTQNSPYTESELRSKVNSPLTEGWQAEPDGVVHQAAQSSPNVVVQADLLVAERNTRNYRPLPFNPKLKQKARELRKAGNLSEVLFWNQVKKKQCNGLDFDRQKIIGNYIVDFYCAQYRIIIEIDGVSHDNKQEYDAKRDAYLQSLGLKIIRIADKDIKKNLDGVMEWLKMHEAFTTSCSEPPHPTGTPPKKGNVSDLSYSCEEKSTSYEYSSRGTTPPYGHPSAGGEWEDASVLLKRIAVEKAQLIKDKKIKPQKPLPPIKDTEKPFDLPKGWVWCRIEQFIENKKYALKAGPFGSSLTKSMYVKSGYKVYGQEQVIKQNPYYGYYFVSSDKYNELISCSISPGDILISLVGTIGKLLVLPHDAQLGIINPRLIKITLNTEIDKKYFSFLYATPFVQIQLKGNASGQTMDVVTMKNLKKLSLPLPPLAEQKAIVAKVEKLLALCDQLERQITDNQTHAEQLMQAVLKEAFSQNSD